MTANPEPATPATPAPAEPSVYGIDYYQGPLPTPADFAGYERVQPGAADRILSMAEIDQKSRLLESHRRQTFDFIIDLLAQLFLYGLAVAATWLALNDKPLEALFAGIGPVAITIYASIRRKPSSEHDKD